MTALVTNTQSSFLTRYQEIRHAVEPAAWVVFWCLNAILNSRVSQLDLLRTHSSYAWWEPVVWEWSSSLVLLLMVPLVIYIEKKLPLSWVTLRTNLPRHLLITFPFCLMHVVGMVALRQLTYLTQNQHYTFGNWPNELGYEYLKDFRTYFFIILTVAFYRLLLFRLQGEASLLEAPDIGLPVEPVDRPERFLVRTLGKEFLLPANEIEWIQAWGNYVNLHVRGHDYPLRSTMAAIEQRIDPKQFVRVHRSYIVNLSFIVEIEPLDSGDAKAKLRDGQTVPVSRRYRDELRHIASS